MIFKVLEENEEDAFKNSPLSILRSIFNYSVRILDYFWGGNRHENSFHGGVFHHHEPFFTRLRILFFSVLVSKSETAWSVLVWGAIKGTWYGPNVTCTHDFLKRVIWLVVKNIRVPIVQLDGSFLFQNTSGHPIVTRFRIPILSIDLNWIKL